MIENRHGETEELGLGESKIPKIAYISTLKTKKAKNSSSLFLKILKGFQF